MNDFTLRPVFKQPQIVIANGFAQIVLLFCLMGQCCKIDFVNIFFNVFFIDDLHFFFAKPMNNKNASNILTISSKTMLIVPSLFLLKKSEILFHQLRNFAKKPFSSRTSY